jgi:hypothetical protein
MSWQKYSIYYWEGNWLEHGYARTFIQGCPISPKVYFQKNLAILGISGDIGTFGYKRQNYYFFVQNLSMRGRSKWLHNFKSFFKFYENFYNRFQWRIRSALVNIGSKYCLLVILKPNPSHSVRLIKAMNHCCALETQGGDTFWKNNSVRFTGSPVEKKISFGF